MVAIPGFKKRQPTARRGAVRRDEMVNRTPGRAAIVGMLLTAGAVVGVGSWWLWPEAPESSGEVVQSEREAPMAIRQIQVAGERRHLQDADIREALQRFAEGEFFSMDMESARRSLLALPWVREVSLRREWPDTLHVKVTEQEPVAVWRGESADPGLVNGYGEVFFAHLENRGGFPLLDGPEGSARRVLKTYAEIRQSLGEIGGGVDSLVLEARNTWQMGLESGTQVRFLEANRADAMARLKLAYNTFSAERQAAIARIDLRYSNGFAVAWKEGHTDV
ncbi:MAG: cell division protein FtsQ/DivIB [Pseudomonadota bacterium]